MYIYIEIPVRAISKDNFKSFGKNGRPFLSPKYKSFEYLCALYAKQQYRGKPLKGDLTVDIIFEFKDRKHCDLFNLPKSVCDAMNKILWEDDRQIKVATLNVFHGCQEERIIITIYL